MSSGVYVLGVFCQGYTVKAALTGGGGVLISHVDFKEG